MTTHAHSSAKLMPWHTLAASLLLGFLLSSPLATGQGRPASDYKEIHELNDKLGQASAYRHRSINATLPAPLLLSRYGITHASELDNALGIHVEAGDELTLTLNRAPAGVALLIYHLEQRRLYRQLLQRGENQVTAPHGGLCYLYYPSHTPTSAPPLDLQIKGGKINGIYHLGNGPKAWAFMRRHSTNGYVEILSPRLHLILPVSAIPTDALEQCDTLIQAYETLFAQQQRAVGFGSYLPLPVNRLTLLPWEADLSAQHEQGILWNVKLMPGLLATSTAAQQIVPLLKRLASSYSTVIPSEQGDLAAAMALLLRESVLYEVHSQQATLPRTGVYDQDAFLRYVKQILNERQLWNGASGSHDERSIISTLIPLWSLYLYKHEVQDDRSYLPRLMERLRHLHGQQLTPSEWRTAFLCALCDAARLNLTEFFVKTRMLAPMNRPLGAQRTHIIQEMEDVKKVWQHAQKYPLPQSRAIHLLRPDNIKLYRERAPIEKLGKTNLQPVRGHITIPARYLRGVIAYVRHEADGQQQLIIPRPTQEGSAGITINFPAECTQLDALAWDGQTHTVYKQ